MYRFVRKKISIVAIAIFASFALLFSCGDTATNPAPALKTIPMSTLYNSVVFDGWATDTNYHGGNKAEDANGYFMDVDGGAKTYVDAGLDSAIIKYLIATDVPYLDARTCQITMMTYKSVAGAKSLFDTVVSHNPGTVVNLGVPASQAIGKVTFGGNQMVYAKYQQFYFELSFTGYADLAISTADAKTFIAKLKTLTQ